MVFMGRWSEQRGSPLLTLPAPEGHHLETVPLCPYCMRVCAAADPVCLQPRFLLQVLSLLGAEAFQVIGWVQGLFLSFVWEQKGTHPEDPGESLGADSLGRGLT